MRVVLFGATGMVGRGVLNQALADPRVSGIVIVGRTPSGTNDPKVTEIIVPDLQDLSDVRTQLGGLGACFFCLGVSSSGMAKDTYRRITYDLTLTVGRVLAEINAGMVFIYVSGQGTDSSESGRIAWARVKGETENALLKLDLRAYMFRPGFIQPERGVTSKTRLYRVVYAITTPLFPLLRRVAGGSITSSAAVGRAMIEVATTEPDGRILGNRDINQLAGA